MKTLHWFLLLSLAYALIGFYNNQQMIQSAHIYKEAMESYTQQLNFENRLLDMEEWTNAEQAWPKKQLKAKKMMAIASAAQQQTRQKALIFLGISLAFGLLVFFFFRGARSDHRILPAAITLVAIICLYAGLFSPMLEIAAFQSNLTVPIKLKGGLFGLNLDFTQQFPGEMYFYYQSKSIVELIQLLFEQNNYVVGISILLFSILIPLSKLLYALASLLRPEASNNSIAQFVLHKTGKWSMADVFVVAIFLGYLAFNSMQTEGIQTKSNVMMGLYFFFAYCILSIALPQFLTRKKEAIAAS